MTTPNVRRPKMGFVPAPNVLPAQIPQAAQPLQQATGIESGSKLFVVQPDTDATERIAWESVGRWRGCDVHVIPAIVSVSPSIVILRAYAFVDGVKTLVASGIRYVGPFASIQQFAPEWTVAARAISTKWQVTVQILVTTNPETPTSGQVRVLCAASDECVEPQGEHIGVMRIGEAGEQNLCSSYDYPRSELVKLCASSLGTAHYLALWWSNDAIGPSHTTVFQGFWKLPDDGTTIEIPAPKIRPPIGYSWLAFGTTTPLGGVVSNAAQVMMWIR